MGHDIGHGTCFPHGHPVRKEPRLESDSYSLRAEAGTGAHALNRLLLCLCSLENVYR